MGCNALQLTWLMSFKSYLPITASDMAPLRPSLNPIKNLISSMLWETYIVRWKFYETLGKTLMMLCEVNLAMCHTNLLLNIQATFFFFFFKFASLRHHKVQNCLRLDSYKLHFVVIFLKDQNFVCDGDGEISNLNHNKIYQCQQIFE